MKFSVFFFFFSNPHSFYFLFNVNLYVNLIRITTHRKTLISLPNSIYVFKQFSNGNTEWTLLEMTTVIIPWYLGHTSILRAYCRSIKQLQVQNCIYRFCRMSGHVTLVRLKLTPVLVRLFKISNVSNYLWTSHLCAFKNIISP